MDNDLIIYLNGEFIRQSEVKRSVFDQGILFGGGIFEGIRVNNKKIFKCQEHINRSYDGAKAIILDIPLNKEELKEVMLEACRQNKVVDGYIRLVVTRVIGAECTGDNIFIVKDNAVYTHPIHVGLLAGIIRNTIINLADKMGIKVIEKELTLFNVYSADECFLTGTAAEVIPVREVDSSLIGNGKPGPITKKNLSAFHEYARSHGTPIYREEKHEK